MRKFKKAINTVLMLTLIGAITTGECAYSMQLCKLRTPLSFSAEGLKEKMDARFKEMFRKVDEADSHSAKFLAESRLKEEIYKHTEIAKLIAQEEFLFDVLTARYKDFIKKALDSNQAEPSSGNNHKKETEAAAEKRTPALVSENEIRKTIVKALYGKIPVVSPDVFPLSWILEDLYGKNGRGEITEEEDEPDMLKILRQLGSWGISEADKDEHLKLLKELFVYRNNPILANPKNRRCVAPFIGHTDKTLNLLSKIILSFIDKDIHFTIDNNVSEEEREIMDLFLEEGGLATVESLYMLKSLCRARGIIKNAGVGRKSTFWRKAKKYNISQNLVKKIKTIYKNQQIPSRIKLIKILVKAEGRPKTAAKMNGYPPTSFQSFLDRRFIDSGLISKIREKAIKRKTLSRSDVIKSLIKFDGRLDRLREHLSMSYSSLRPFLEKYNISQGLIDRIITKRRENYIQRRREAHKLRQERTGFPWSPLEFEALNYSVDELMDRIELRRSSSKERTKNILESYIANLKNMKRLGIKESLTRDSGMISCLVHEAVRLIKLDSKEFVTFSEVATILEDQKSFINKRLGEIKNIMDEKKTENIFMPNDRLGTGVEFEEFDEKDIASFLKYVKRPSVNNKPIITEKLLRDYLIHAQLMREIGITKGRCLLTDYTSVFIKLAKEKIKLGDHRLIKDKEIGVKLQIPTDSYGHANQLVRLKDKVRDRLNSGWANIFSVNEEEDRILGEVFVKSKLVNLLDRLRAIKNFKPRICYQAI